MLESIDRPTVTRKGEELNVNGLNDYLRQHLEDLNGELKISQFPSGYSNLTYLLSIDEKEYVLRKPPIGAKIKSAHDMGREYKVLSTLKPFYNKIPQPILYCEDKDIIGSPFYLMERVKGVILRNDAPKGLPLTAEVMRNISKESIINLADLHSINLHGSDLAQLGNPEGYVKRQVEGWTNRYFNAKTDEIESMQIVAQWMQDNLPDSREVSFIHNDYKYDNLVFDPNNLSRVIAVLDWEMATVGDPLMDLGTTLAYWAEADDHPALKPFNLTWMDGNLTRNEVVRLYAKLSGIDTSNILFYYVFGLFKIAVIVQQIYARYKKGLTQDARFSNLLQVVIACADNAKNALEKGYLSKLD